MNRIEFDDALNRLTADSVSFYVDGEKVSSRFDLGEKGLLDLSLDDTLSFDLYSFITQLTIAKAQGKESGSRTQNRMSDYFLSILRSLPEELRKDAEAEKEKAEDVLRRFLTTDSVALAELLSAFAPLLLLRRSLKEGKPSKKAFSEFDRHREEIFNGSVLGVRSIFHCFLTWIDDPNQILVDKQDPTNGLLLYRDILFVPTYEEAFTLARYQQVIQFGLSRASSSLPLASVKGTALLSLSKDLILVSPFDKDDRQPF